MLAEGDRMLAWLSKEYGEGTVEAWIKAAARRVYASPSSAIPPRKVQKEMTQRSRAEVILAWFLHKRQGDAIDIIKLYLAAELYTWRKDLIFGPRIRNGFTNRVVGLIVAGWADVRQEREVYKVRLEEQPSWANERYRRYEEVVKVVDKYLPQQSIYKMLGRMVREILSDEGLILSVKSYYEHLLVSGEA